MKSCRAFSISLACFVAVSFSFFSWLMISSMRDSCPWDCFTWTIISYLQNNIIFIICLLTNFETLSCYHWEYVKYRPRSTMKPWQPLYCKDLIEQIKLNQFREIRKYLIVYNPLLFFGWVKRISNILWWPSHILSLIARFKMIFWELQIYIVLTWVFTLSLPPPLYLLYHTSYSCTYLGLNPSPYSWTYFTPSLP